MSDSRDDKNISLEDMYKKMMSTLPSPNLDFSKWEMTGDVYKQFSIYTRVRDKPGLEKG